MRYAYVLYRTEDGWEALAPGWGRIRARGATRDAALGELTERLTSLATELFCRSLPYPEDIGVEVGCVTVLGDGF